MSKEQIEKIEIEKMARVIETTEQIARDAHCGLPSPRMYAKDLYWHGYRKQSEIIDEFAERIKKEFTDYPNPISYLEISESGFCKIVDRLAKEMKGEQTNAE